MSAEKKRFLNGFLEKGFTFHPFKGYSLFFSVSTVKFSKNFSFRSFQTIIFCLLLISVISSCEDTFEPFEENEKFFFTMYGYLDASADTQWVRISPVRGTFDAPPEIPDMEVNLDNLSDGSSVLMNHKLVQFGNQFNAINVWTEKKVQSGINYRVRALNPNGSESQVVVTIPDSFPTPKILTEAIPGRPVKYFLLIDEVERLADVQSRWHFRLSTPFWEEERFHTFSLRELVGEVETVPNSYRVELTPDKEQEIIMENSLVLSIPGGQIEFLENQLFIASAGPEWNNDIASIEDLVYNLPDGFSNVEDGLGYMVGIYSRNIPFRTCLNEARQLVGCPEVDPFY